MCDCFYLHGQTGGSDSVGSTAWPWTPNQTGLLWQSHLCRSWCHVACCWLRQVFCAFALAFSAGHSRQCVLRFSGSSLVVGLELSWTLFPVPYLLELCEAARAGLTVLLVPSHDLPLASLHPFSSLTASPGGLLGLCIALRYALTCSTLRLVSMDDRSSR